MDAEQQPKQKRPYKRKMTEQRKSQNRAAQKIYRERQKERLQLLERQVTELQQDKEGDAGDGPENDALPLSPLEHIVQDISEADIDIALGQSVSNTDSSSVTELKRLLKADDAPDLDDLVEYALTNKPDLSTILVAGLRSLKVEQETSMALEQTRKPTAWATGAWQSVTMHTPAPIYPLPDPSRDGIFLSRQSPVEVVFYNAAKIGLTIEQLMTADAQSPWYCPTGMTATALIALQRVPPDLYPTPAQLRIPHHPFVDTLPFPWLRERAVTLSCIDPPAFNRTDLKRDILRGGLTCWRTRGREEGLPWDRRNWEAEPWFLEKWAWLIEEQGKVAHQSRWWRAMRGC